MKIKRYILGAMLLSFALLFCLNTKVQAETTNEGFKMSEYIDNMYIKKTRDDGSREYKQGRILRRTSDNKFVYCLQPFVEINHNIAYNFTMKDYAQIMNLSEEQWQKVALIAYYGYQYGNHTADKWYYITQVMIWRVVAPNNEIFFTDTLKGERNDNLYASEIKEINDLVSRHNIKPSFDIKSTTMNIGGTLELEDKNKVLSNYSISYSNIFSVSKDGNKLNIKANQIGTGRITLKKTANLYDSDPVLYYAIDSQNILGVGNYDPIQVSFDLKVIGGKITLHKLDKETGESMPQGDGSLEGALYGIYDEGGIKIAEIRTNADGTVQSDYLPFIGKYKVRELTSSVGYEIDGTEYEFEITEDQLFPDLTVYEQVIRRKIKIGKFYANGDTGKLLPEENVTFEFYDNKNSMVARVTTDKDGYAELSLPYGTYIGKQMTTKHGLEKVDDFEITINEETQEEIKLAFTDAPIKAKLKVIKIDSETKKVITRNNIKFKIFDVTNNKYVCQTITYPTSETICEYKTDENGIFYTPYELDAGTYRLEEVDQEINGYVWNKNSKEFTIDENSELKKDSKYGIIFEVKFENKQVKGTIKIKKVGEIPVIENGFKYEEIELPNVIFDVIANEDITIGGKEYYKKGDLVSTIQTNEDGIATLENLPLGKYVLVEKSTEENHVLFEKPYEFEISYKDQYTEIVEKEIKLKNYYKKGTLEFTKTDLVDGSPIANVEIKIFTEDDELVFTGITNNEGKIIIDDLPINVKMYIIETRPADNYQITEEKVYFEIKENGEIVKANLKNEKVPIDVPDTDLYADYSLEIKCGFLILIAIGGIVYAKKTKNK